jgi:GNAT superfamily N-acetyltransferase
MTLQADLGTTHAEDHLLVPRPYDHPHARALALALYRDQLQRYGHAENPHCDARTFDPPEGLFLVAYAGRTPVGCGGFRRYDEQTAEIKRMFVHRRHRGRGLGGRILNALETAAARSGAGHVLLETGARNLAACALYTRFGYQPVPGYSPNRDSKVNRAFARSLVGGQSKKTTRPSAAHC